MQRHEMIRWPHDAWNPPAMVSRIVSVDIRADSMQGRSFFDPMFISQLARTTSEESIFDKWTRFHNSPSSTLVIYRILHRGCYYRSGGNTRCGGVHERSRVRNYKENGRALLFSCTIFRFCVYKRRNSTCSARKRLLLLHLEDPKCLRRFFCDLHES